MGSQVCSNKDRSDKKKLTLTTVALKHSSKFHDVELRLLVLIFKDLARRSPNRVGILRDSFIQYFNIIGLWGEQIFNKFTTRHDDFLNEDEFYSGLVYYIKCPEPDRIKNLFELYNLHGQHGIQKSDFLQMLYNYPREDLKKILNDQLFLEDSQILNEIDRSKRQRPRKGSQDILEQSLRIIRKLSHNVGSEKQIFVEQSGRKMEPMASNISRGSAEMMMLDQSLNNLGSSNSRGYGITFQMTVNGKQIEINANLNLLVKKYVENVYKLKQDQLLSFSEFEQFVTKHPNLMKTLYSAFNYETWGVDPVTKEPLYKNQPLDYCGELYMLKDKLKPQSIYCELYPQVMMLFQSKGDSMPKKIVNLRGLTVEERADSLQQKYAFEIYHVNKNYPPKIFYVQDEQTFKLWVNALQPYFNGEINKNYSILQKIGEGRFSMVYKCQHKTTKALYALKIINKLNLSNEEKDLIRHEVDIMKLMNHQCIIKLIEHIENRTHIHLVTELVEDGDLFDYVQQKNYLQDKEAALILNQLIDSLIYIHSIGIVHRDIKPENIMIIVQDRQVRQVKLIDFGFANYVNIINERSQNEGLCGTPNYIAPEVLMYKKITFKVDNFALGSILYFMLSGYLPFDSTLPQEIIENTMDGRYDIEDEFWNCVDDEAKDLVRGLLEIDPEKRLTLQEAKNHKWLKKMLHS